MAFCKLLRNVISDKYFYFLFFINIICNLMVLVYGSSPWKIIQICSLTALFAFVAALLIRIFSNKKMKLLAIAFFASISNILLTIDTFLFVRFHKVLSQDILDILAETNPREIREFVTTYLQWPTIVTFVVVVFFINFILWKISKRLQTIRYLPILTSMFVGFGFYVAVRCVVMFAFYRNGESVPQYTAITRLSYSSYVLRQRMNAIKNLASLNQRIVNDKHCASDKQNTYIILILGESFSVYHSSIYGYKVNTNPLLTKRIKSGEMVAYDNVVAIDDHTHGAMKSIFSLSENGKGFDSAPLFPAIFRAAGFNSTMHDRQYTLGGAVTFLSDPVVSAALFDVRNVQTGNYDDDFMDLLTIPSADKQNQLIVTHIMGQHYTYADRYPKNYDHFASANYQGNEVERQQKAQYDNATLYNDKVIDTFLKRFEKLSACVVYVSDHGEEIYDQSDYMGHGNAAAVKDLRYQIRIPLMIWCSNLYKEQNPDQWQKLKDAQHLPITSDDISHLLIDLAGIKTRYLDETRSFINPKYNAKRHRIVLNSIDYDDLK